MAICKYFLNSKARQDPTKPDGPCPPTTCRNAPVVPSASLSRHFGLRRQSGSVDAAFVCNRAKLGSKPHPPGPFGIRNSSFISVIPLFYHTSRKVVFVWYV